MLVLLASSVNLTKSANILLMLDVCLCFQCFPRPVFILNSEQSGCSLLSFGFKTGWQNVAQL